MAHPKGGYRNRAGVRIPGTTTIIGRYKESGPLLWWAFGQGRAAERRGIWEQAKGVMPRAYKKLFGTEEPDAIYNLYDKRDEAADIGTEVHELVERHIRGEIDLRSGELRRRPEIQSGVDAYLQWESMTQLEIVEQEMELVSEQYQFGGSPDAIGRINGELCLIDWKTSKGVYPDFLIQLAAYNQLWIENFPDRPLTGGFHLCKFSKEHGDFAHHYWPDLSVAWDAFKHMRALYALDKELKARAS